MSDPVTASAAEATKRAISTLGSTLSPSTTLTTSSSSTIPSPATLPQWWPNGITFDVSAAVAQVRTYFPYIAAFLLSFTSVLSPDPFSQFLKDGFLLIPRAIGAVGTGVLSVVNGTVSAVATLANGTFVPALGFLFRMAVYIPFMILSLLWSIVSFVFSPVVFYFSFWARVVGSVPRPSWGVVKVLYTFFGISMLIGLGAAVGVHFVLTFCSIFLDELFASANGNSTIVTTTESSLSDSTATTAVSEIKTEKDEDIEPIYHRKKSSLSSLDGDCKERLVRVKEEQT